MPSLLVSIEKWVKDHLVKNKAGTEYVFYCGRKSLVVKCEELDDSKNICASCYSLANIGPICNNGKTEVGVQSIIKCPIEVSETKLIKIVGDQTNCKPNALQPGCTNWDYLAIEYDPKYPDERRSYFEVSKEEIEKWRKDYK